MLPLRRTAGFRSLLALARQFPWIWPRGRVRDARGWIARRQARREWYFALRGDWVCERHPAETLIFGPLPAGSERAPEPFRDAAHRRAPAAALYFFDGADLFGDSGVVLSRDNRLFVEFVHNFSHGPVRRSAWHRPFAVAPRRTRLVPQLTALLAAPGCSNHYHWLFDVLPRLELLGEWRDRIELFAVPAGLSAVQREALALAGIGEERLLLLQPGERLTCRRLLVPSLPGSEGASPGWVLPFLRDTWGAAIPAQPTGRPLLYLGRGAGAGRPVEGEEALRAELARRGFVPAECDRLTLAEQVNLFRHARQIVAIHGAALANLAFAPPGAAVVELFSQDYLRPDCYWTLARTLGLRYACWIDPRAPGRAQPWGALRPEAGEIARLLDGLDRGLGR